MQDQYLNLRHHRLKDTLPENRSDSLTSEHLSPENCPYNFYIQEVPRVVHLSITTYYWKLLRSYSKLQKELLESTARGMFSVPPKTDSVLVSVLLVEQRIFSINMQCVGKENKDADQVLVEIRGTDLKLIAPEVIVILTKMHSTVFVMNISIIYFVRYWKEMKKQKVCSWQTTWWQIGILYFWLDDGWIFRKSMTDHGPQKWIRNIC